MKHVSATHTSSCPIIGGGEMGERIRSFAWESTSLGPISSWPQSLITSVNLVLHSPVPLVMLWGKDGIMVYNDAYSIFAGARHPSLLGSKVLEGWPEVADFNANVMKHGLNGKTLLYKDQRLTLYRNNIAEDVWMDLTYSPIIDEAGKAAGVLAIVFETTERILAEQLQTKTKQDLHQSEAQYRRLIDLSPIPMAVHIKGTLAYANQAAVKLIGAKHLPDILGKNVLHFIHPDYKKVVKKRVEQIYNKQKAHTDIIEEKFVKLDGEVIDVEIASLYVEFEGKPAVQVIVRDITERKRSEEKLKENEARLQLALDAGAIGVWDWDIIENKIRWTDKVYKIHEVDKNEFDGEFVTYITKIHPEDKERVEKAIKNSLAGKAPYDIEFKIITAKGKIKWISTSAKVIFQGKKPVRMLGATIDITKRKELERQKDEFLGIASHELKTPVTSIKAYGQVLQRIFAKEGNDKAVLQLAKMDAQINKLTDLISDLLDVTKINSGKLITHEEYFSMASLIKEKVAELQLTTEKHTLQVHIEKNTKVYADQERVGQVLTNLITNAIKYSPYAEKIIITETTDGNYVTVSVEDFGIGIPKDKHERVFEQFFRVSGDKEYTFPGLGLGLYISSEIIKRQGGKIWVESREGKGSTFYFMLPCKKSKTKAKITHHEVILHE